MDDRQAVQHQEYEFPYHYLVRFEGDNFHSFRNWGWSLQYATALAMVSERLRASRPKSHVDIGCGDGALMALLAREFPDIDLVGMDYDAHAISLAQMMSPGLNYQQRDIINDPPEEIFDSASMIEVFEHIPPEISSDFLAASRKLLKPGASLLLTVPHANKPLIPKHYRHFTFDLLKSCVSPYFEVMEMFAFEKETRASKLVSRLNRRPGFFFESARLNRYLLKQQLEMRSTSEGGYWRIFAELVAR